MSESFDELFNVDFDEDEESEMRNRLLRAQLRIAENKLPVVLVLGGISGSGRSTTFNRMRSWMNAREMQQNAYDKTLPPNDIAYRRFWRDLPAAGQIGVYLSSWYTAPIIELGYGRISKEEYETKVKEIKSFERTLADNGYVVLKYWLDLSEKKEKKYLEYLGSDDELKWKIMDYDYESLKYYDELRAATKDIIELTDKKYAPWRFIKGETRSDRVAEALTSFCDDIKAITKNGKRYEPDDIDPADIMPQERKFSLKESFITEEKMKKSDYEREIKRLRSELNALFTKAETQGKRIVIGFEGPDASGKGGVISRLSSALNPRSYNVFPISAPDDAAKKRHYLWRFWYRLSEQKLLTIFDRTWYGRVLVERIEKFTPEKLWLRAYKEINQFEQQLHAAGNIVVKYLLYISKDEQMRRFEAREDTDYKKWKITDEDWRNRDKWDEYDSAFEDMVELTDTEHAPWVVIATDDKKTARIQAMRELKRIMEEELKS